MSFVFTKDKDNIRVRFNVLNLSGSGSNSEEAILDLKFQVSKLFAELDSANIDVNMNDEWNWVI